MANRMPAISRAACERCGIATLRLRSGTNRSTGVSACSRTREKTGEPDAHDQPTGALRSAPSAVENKVPALRGEPAEAGCVHSGADDDPQEAELGLTEDCAGAADERGGGHRLHSRHRPQPGGALDRLDPRRT